MFSHKNICNKFNVINLRVSPGNSLVVRGQGLESEQRGWPVTIHFSFQGSKSRSNWVLVGFIIHSRTYTQHFRTNLFLGVRGYPRRMRLSIYPAPRDVCVRHHSWSLGHFNNLKKLNLDLRPSRWPSLPTPSRYPSLPTPL